MAGLCDCGQVHGVEQRIAWHFTEYRGVFPRADGPEGLVKRLPARRIDEVDTGAEMLLHLQGVYVREAELQGLESRPPGRNRTKEGKDGCHPAFKKERVLLIDLKNPGEVSP